MGKIIPPHRLQGNLEEVIPLINDNFEKMVYNVEMMGPVETTTGTCGGYIPTTYLLDVISVVFDKPDYDGYAAFLPKYDIFVDHPVSTGTITINNGSGSSTTVNIGDAFISNEDVAYKAGDSRARYWYATTSATVGAGGSGSVSCVAEAPGTRYNKTAHTIYFVSAPALTTRRFVNLFPTFGGSGGSGSVTYTVTSTGGTDTDDTTYLWPSGSNLTTNMKKLSLGQHLSITPDPGNYTMTGEDQRTDPKSISTLSIRNEDASTHRYYVKVGGILLSGKSERLTWV